MTDALVRLVLEKRYQAITIQDVLDRADVGRSTFYSHFRGKDDLLLRSFERLLERLDEHLDLERPASGRLAPVRELFAHVGEVGAFHRALARAHMLERLYETGTNQLSHTIGRRLSVREGVPLETDLTVQVAARAHAGALFALLRWWIERSAPLDPARMDALYHEIVSGGRVPPAPPGP